MKALIVQFDTISAKLIQAALNSEAISCLHAKSPEEALSVVASARPSVIIVDTNSVANVSHSLVVLIEKTRKHIPTFVVSSEYSPKDRKTLKEAGATELILKPVQARELTESIWAAAQSWKRTSSEVIKTGNLLVDVGSKTIKIDGKFIHVTDKEFQVIESLFLKRLFFTICMGELMNLRQKLWTSL